jgi:N-acetylmuramoyl-L-alanine amidase
VFKVQILTSGRKLKSKDARLKGIEDFDCYAEGGLVKYTVGASTNYREIVRLRKKLLEKFPEAFIIAFKNGQKVNVNDAIKENK